jgi:hypothetical protein
MNNKDTKYAIRFNPTGWLPNYISISETIKSHPNSYLETEIEANFKTENTIDEEELNGFNCHNKV